MIQCMKPILRDFALAPCLAMTLAALAAAAQTEPAASITNTAVSAAEVAAFMQAPQSLLDGSPNPKQVPLLLAAIQREPAGRWATFLQAYAFGSEHARAWRLPPASRTEVYTRAIEYLTAARETVSRALQAKPGNRELTGNLGTLDAGLALAYVESGTRAKEARAIAETLLASNTVTNWNYGNVIYEMHSLLGRIALGEGDMAAARRHLAESGQTPGSPQLDSFGPDFVLAGELLRKGERDAVLAGLPVEHDSLYVVPAMDEVQSRDFHRWLSPVLTRLGGDATGVGAPYVTDASHYAAAGAPAIVLGPGDLAQAHTKDEWVELDQLRQASALYLELLRVPVAGGPRA